MIVDSITRWKEYDFGPAWEKAFTFLREIDPSVEAGRYIIDGKNIYANVDEYMTKPLYQGRYEAHRKYVDIQYLLFGRETVGWAPMEMLKIKESYDEERDVEFLEQTKEFPASVSLIPGMFVALFPEDGHMPGLFAGKGPEPVKKVVVKVAVDVMKGLQK